MRIPSSPLVAVCAASIALSVAGCGGTAPATSPTGTSASSATTSTSPSRPTSGASIDAADLGKRVSAAIKKAGTGAMTITAANVKILSDFDLTGAKPKQHLTVTAGAQTMEMTTIDGILYLKGMTKASDGKPWVKVDPEKDALVAGLVKGMSGSAFGTDSVDTLFFAATVTFVSADANGTTYDVTIDSGKLVTSTASASVPGKIVKATYVVDPQDRPAKVTTELSGEATTVTYGDWGKAVTIAAPPADQVGVMPAT